MSFISRVNVRSEGLAHPVEPSAGGRRDRRGGLAGIGRPGRTHAEHGSFLNGFRNMSQVHTPMHPPGPAAIFA